MWKFRSVLFFLAAPATLLLASDVRPHLSVTPQAVEPGQQVQLLWDARGAEKIYLSGHGLVDPSGIITFVPAGSMPIILATDGPAGPYVVGKEISVLGEKGGGGFPDRSEFKRRVSLVKVPSITLPEFLDAAWNLIGNDLEYVFEERVVNRTSTILVTNKKTLPVAPTEARQIAEKRLAFLVEPASSGDHVLLSIGTFVEYRRRRERGWREDPQGGKAEAEELKEALLERSRARNQ